MQLGIHPPQLLIQLALLFGLQMIRRALLDGSHGLENVAIGCDALTVVGRGLPLRRPLERQVDGIVEHLCGGRG